tara:strand:- start:704 stop:829 length:126 start_codon:yes stop_codon:yes gene_type:complete
MGWLGGMPQEIPAFAGMTEALNRHPNVTPAYAGVYKQEKKI